MKNKNYSKILKTIWLTALIFTICSVMLGIYFGLFNHSMDSNEPPRVVLKFFIPNGLIVLLLLLHLLEFIVGYKYQSKRLNELSLIIVSLTIFLILLSKIIYERIPQFSWDYFLIIGPFLTIILGAFGHLIYVRVKHLDHLNKE